MGQLSKKDILHGINNPQLITIKSLNGDVWLRPLSGAELDEIGYIEAEGLGSLKQNASGNANSLNPSKIVQNNKINVLKYNKASDKAEYTLIHKSLTNEHYADDPWTMDEVKSLSKDAQTELSDKIKEISGAKVTKQDVQKFPENK